MKKVRLTKVSDNPNALRTKEVVGVAYAEPTVGKSFCVWSDPLEQKDAIYREVLTSIVQELLPAGEFRTLNSVYKVEELE